MPNENGEWILYGLADNDPKRIKTWNALIKVIDKICKSGGRVFCGRNDGSYWLVEW